MAPTTRSPNPQSPQPINTNHRRISFFQETQIGGNELLMVDLSKISSNFQEVMFTVTIHEADDRQQNFGQVRNSFIRIYDAVTDEEICKRELGEDFSIETGVEFGCLYRREGKWRIEAVGVGCKDGFAELIGKFT
jgi:tellurium resistance protein TerD